MGDLVQEVQREFAEIRANVGKRVVVVEQFHDREETTRGKLVDFDEYGAVELWLGKGGRLSESQALAFMGVFAGIKEIRDAKGKVIYNNPQLDYKKAFYDCFIKLEDNEAINRMRRAKFGEGHDLEMLSD